MTSKRLVISYAIDWLVIISAIIISLLLATVNPDFHTFCVLDMNLSYPYRIAKVSMPLFLLLSIIFPIVTVVLISIFTSAGRQVTTDSTFTRSRTRAQKFLSLNNSLLGLGVSLGTSTVIVTGCKSLTGKPRPNFLSICVPDVENIVNYTVGGFGADLNRLWVMVDVEICTQTDKSALRDAFRSFPSGYATIAFAGLWYLSLFLCHRFGVGFLSSYPLPSVPHAQTFNDDELLLSNNSESELQSPEQSSKNTATFPVYMLLLPYIPLGLAIFIAGTRYFDFRNHGFDVLAGSAVGSLTAWLGFRMCHSPLGGAERVRYPER